MASRSLDVDERPPTSRPTRRRLVVASAVVAVLLTGCASVPSNTPTDYDDVTQANYLAACEAAGRSASDCQCYYDGIVENVAFEDFKDFEDQVKDDPTAVPGAYEDIVDDCAPGATTPPPDVQGDDGDAGDTTTTTRPPS